MRYCLPAALICLSLAGCGTMGQPDSSAHEGVQTVVLSKAQDKVVRDGVREIVANAAKSGSSQATSSHISAYRLSGKALVNVCGEAHYKMTADGRTRTAPFFMEVADKEGVPYAKRGQVGFDKLKKAKVVYLCNRANGE